MIPLRDNIRRRSFPYINIAIILANIAVFFYQINLASDEMQSFILNYGAIPANLCSSFDLLLSGNPLFVTVFSGAAISLFTSVFLHGGWLHLLGNMIYLWVFGDNVEDRLGHFRYLIVYLFMGAGGSMVHIILNPLSEIPLIGASGAIAGVLGLYFLFYPGAKVTTLVPLFIFITFVQIPAVIFLGFWFLLQLYNAFGTADGSSVQSVAWWAHVGGFAIGMFLGVIYRRR